MKAICIVFGGGGHARVIIDSLQASEAAEIYAVLDSDSSLHGRNIFGVPIWGYDILPELTERGVNHFVVGVGSVGSGNQRVRLFELGLSYNLTPLGVRHPSAICSRWAEVGPGAQLLPGSIVNAGAQLGANVIVNSGAVVEHDCLIGAHAHVATGAKLSGGVYVGSGAHIGAGATVRQSIKIGDGAIVGAGAVVVKDVPPGMVVIGVPAEPLKTVDEGRDQDDSEGTEVEPSDDSRTGD
ncbi:MAG: UDP-perosamine 4-acetyltransferase [Acidobacteriota bacterium]|jgi:UDP-perosamine 4-acetyltransferase|nr:UDP-perosamine 4-acetyltransferase [Acidobacteriota bacterium]